MKKYIIVFLTIIFLSGCKYKSENPQIINNLPGEQANYLIFPIPTITPTLPLDQENVSNWCNDLSVVVLENNTTVDFKESNIISIKTDFESGTDQIWNISLSDGEEKMIYDELNSPSLGLALLPDGDHFIKIGSTMVRMSDLNGSGWTIVENRSDLQQYYVPYSPVWELLSTSSNIDTYQMGVYHSPNGKYAAIWNPGDEWLIIKNMETDLERKIIQTDSPNTIWGGSWSPNSEYYAFSYYKDGNPYYSDVYLIKPDEDDLISITDPFDYGLMNQPIWSPDGKKIAVPMLAADGGYAIVIIIPGENKVDQFKVSQIIRMHSIQDQGTIAWSPDSQWIAYISEYIHKGVEILNTNNGKIYCTQNDDTNFAYIIDWQ
jgi:hypothetical protein